ncbi:MAG: methylated-DNA-protein-cysteine methyltransferase-like protein [Bradymonadia bacterium]
MDVPKVVGAGFNEAVYLLVRQVPPGRVTTYGDIAGFLGSRRVARHVGFALAALADPTVAWHRVINAQGRISFKGDSGRAMQQRALLEADGIQFDARDRVDLKALRWLFPETPLSPISAP